MPLKNWLQQAKYVERVSAKRNQIDDVFFYPNQYSTQNAWVGTFYIMKNGTSEAFIIRMSNSIPRNIFLLFQ